MLLNEAVEVLSHYGIPTIKAQTAANAKEAQAMIEELSGAQILMGARGQKPFDIDSLQKIILRLSQLLVDFLQIKELDINPLRIFHENEGCSALDARIIL